MLTSSRRQHKRINKRIRKRRFKLRREKLAKKRSTLPPNLATIFFFKPPRKLKVSQRTAELIEALAYYAEKKNYKKYHKVRFLLNQTKEYQNFRRRVLARDAWLCVYCQSHGYQVHHVKPVFSFVHLVLEAEVAVTVCTHCHAKQHGK